MSSDVLDSANRARSGGRREDAWRAGSRRVTGLMVFGGLWAGGVAPAFAATGDGDLTPQVIITGTKPTAALSPVELSTSVGSVIPEPSPNCVKG